ncbi:hypothetical protein ACFSEO_17110 [Agromyces cerinus subsp. nitratus]
MVLLRGERQREEHGRPRSPGRNGGWMSRAGAGLGGRSKWSAWAGH